MGDNNNTERRIVFIRPIGDRRFKKWVKVVTGVDTTISNGYAFEGSFIGLDRKAELAVGTFLLYFGMEGTRTRQWPCVALKEVTPDGLETLYERYDLDRSWALDVRDDIAAIIAARRSSSSADVTGDDAAGDAAGSGAGAANPLLAAAAADADTPGDLRPGGQRLALAAAADAAADDADTGMAWRRRRIIAERDEDEAAGCVDGEDSP